MWHQKAVHHKHHHTEKQVDYLRFECCVGNKPVTKSAFAPQPVQKAASDYSRVLYKIISTCADFIRQLHKGACSPKHHCIRRAQESRSPPNATEQTNCFKRCV